MMIRAESLRAQEKIKLDMMRLGLKIKDMSINTLFFGVSVIIGLVILFVGAILFQFHYMFSETTSAVMTYIRNFTDINLGTYKHVLNASTPAIADSTIRVVNVFGYAFCVFGCVLCAIGLGVICVIVQFILKKVYGIWKVVFIILTVPCGIVEVLYRKIKCSAAGSSRKPGDTRDQASWGYAGSGHVGSGYAGSAKIWCGQIKKEETNVSGVSGGSVKILSGQIKNEDTNVSGPRIPCFIVF